MTPDRDFKRDDSVEQEMVKAVEELDDTEKAILERLGGALTTRQKKRLEDLRRLHHTLRGPEDVLDHGNYSRPFPPHTHTGGKR